MSVTSTVLSDFQRTVRKEPLYYIYKHRIYVERDGVNADDVTNWLKLRYCEAKKGNRYRIVTYHSTDGGHYVDYILMETCTENDLLFMKMRWGWTKHKVARERIPRRRLTKSQKAELDAIIRKAREDFYNGV